MIYSFNSNVAEKVGVDGAVMLNSLGWWVSKNAHNNKNFHDGHFWTYNSMQAFLALFPFWTPKVIRRILSKLESEGYILTGNYNKSAYDRTKWYTLTKKAFDLLQISICPNEKIDLPKRANGNDHMGEPIPVNIPVSNNSSIESGAEAPTLPKPSKKKFVPPTLEEVKAYVAEKKLGISPQKFFDYYEAGCWHDSSGKAVRNWKQKCLTWDGQRQGVHQQEQKPRLKQPRII